MSKSAAKPRSSSGAARARRDHKLTSVRRYVLVGLLTILGLFGGVGGWAATTDLAGAVQATGTVVVAENVKKIQHPTGGVIGQIYVANGDHVRAGDTLVRLDETITRANFQLIQSRSMSYQAAKPVLQPSAMTTPAQRFQLTLQRAALNRKSRISCPARRHCSNPASAITTNKSSSSVRRSRACAKK